MQPEFQRRIPRSPATGRDRAERHAAPAALGDGLAEDFIGKIRTEVVAESGSSSVYPLAIDMAAQSEQTATVPEPHLRLDAVTCRRMPQAICWTSSGIKIVSSGTTMNCGSLVARR